MKLKKEEPENKTLYAPINQSETKIKGKYLFRFEKKILNLNLSLLSYLYNKMKNC